MDALLSGPGQLLQIMPEVLREDAIDRIINCIRAVMPTLDRRQYRHWEEKIRAGDMTDSERGAFSFVCRVNAPGKQCGGSGARLLIDQLVWCGYGIVPHLPADYS